MNKADLINEVAESTGLTKVKASEVINTIVSAVQGALSKGEKVTLVGFGTFGTAKRKSRKGRNPKTGAELTIPEKTVVRFKSGSALAETVNS